MALNTFDMFFFFSHLWKVVPYNADHNLVVKKIMMARDPNFNHIKHNSGYLKTSYTVILIPCLVVGAIVQ